MTPFQKILEHYRKYSFSEADKGNRFERLMQAYLLTDPKYSSRLNKVWLWNEFSAAARLHLVAVKKRQGKNLPM